jgi:predicted ArsR family transcriptional regulator
MFLPGFRDLIKPQWVSTIEELKLSGGLPVSELSRRIEVGYMAVKQYCEDLKELGYLDRSRVPRTEVGRPEIFYRLTKKADALFPQAGTMFSLEVLDGLKPLFGESAPERVLFQYFQQQQEEWLPKLGKAKSLIEKATLLAGLREKTGCFDRCKYDAEKGFRIEEYHHPLQRIFEKYPRAAAMELRMMEQLLGAKVVRREIPGGRAGPARIDFEVATLGSK